MPAAVTAAAAASSIAAVAHFDAEFTFETDCWDVHEALENGADFMLLGVRSPALFARGHVPGAVNLPHAKIVESKIASWPLDTVFVTYCAGPHCNGAVRGALRLARLGRPVKILEAAEWLIQIGRPLWRTEDLTPEALEPDVAAGLYFLAFCSDMAVGTMRFQLDDAIFWPDAELNEAAYIHKLAVRRRWAGRGTSARLLEFSVRRATQLGVNYLRLDTMVELGRLRARYQEFGFQYHSDFQAGPLHVARYQILLPSAMNEDTSSGC